MLQTLRIIWSYVKILSIVATFYCATLFRLTSAQHAAYSTCRLIVSENVLFIKCIQAMSSHPIIPKIMHPILQVYTDSTPVLDAEIDHDLLRYICQKYSVVIDSTPSHTGMVAMVFCGKIGHTPVVVKLAKRCIESRIIDGCAHLSLLRRLMRCISHWNETVASVCDALETVIESTNYLQRQCDLTHELRAMQDVRDRWLQFQATYEGTSSICNRLNRINVPYICNDLDDPRASSFFIMEQIQGLPAFKLIDMAIKRRCVSLLQYFILCQGLILDYYHTDMHSGNVLFHYNEDTDTLTMGIYDYGMHVRMGKDERAFVSNILELLMGNEDVNKETFDAAHFCRLLFEVDHVPMHDTPKFRELCAKCGKEALTGAFSAETMHRFILDISHIIGIKPKIRDTNMQLLLGTSMVNSLTYELSDNDPSILFESGVRVYEDVMLS